jgi:predicted negative regulator of RcsB-dependent stress response
MALYNLGRMLHAKGEDDDALEVLRRSKDTRAPALIAEITGN